MEREQRALVATGAEVRKGTFHRTSRRWAPKEEGRHKAGFLEGGPPPLSSSGFYHSVKNLN